MRIPDSVSADSPSIYTRALLILRAREESSSISREELAELRRRGREALMRTRARLDKLRWYPRPGRFDRPLH